MQPATDEAANMRFFELGTCLLVVAGCAALVADASSTASSSESVVRTEMRVEAGAATAELWCSQCHLISPDSNAAALADAPSFYQVANRPETTRDEIEAYLLDPHPPMPDLNLSSDELKNLSAYIMSHKDAAAEQ
jgi:mono/diheme cytochrome c family protein